MHFLKNKLVPLLWAVIGVLLAGGIAMGGLLVHKADALNQTNNDLTGDISSLREQLRQAKATPTPSPTPTPDYSASATPTPSPSPTPTPTKTPASSSNR